MVPGGGVGYVPGMSPDVDTLPEDPVLLRAMVRGLRAEIAGIAAANRAMRRWSRRSGSPSRG
jgi:hypothetical protein